MSRREIRGALAVSCGPQRHIEGWTLRKRPGTPMAEAAEAALGETTDGTGLATSHTDGPGLAGDGPPGSYST